MFSTVNLIGYSVADPGQVARGSLSSAEKYTARLKYKDTRSQLLPPY